MFIYLDESGDLGFDFENKKPSRFFVITLLAVPSRCSIKQINKAVYRTLERLNKKRNKSRIVRELKGGSTILAIKSYFLKHMNSVSDWSIYSVILDKKFLITRLKGSIHKDRIYNHMTHQLLEYIDFFGVKNVNLIVDRSKDNLGIKEFNEFLYTNSTLALNSEVKLNITHDSSENHKGIQAVDMFCYGIYRKYERQDNTWYKLFSERIKQEVNFKHRK
jgi:hypothetical protein